MTGSDFIFGVTFCLSIIFPLSIQAQSATIVRISSNTSYVDLGKTLILNATYIFNGTGGVGVGWKGSDDTKLVEQIRLGGLDIIDPRASLEGRATLVLKNTKLSDNGTFTLWTETRSKSEFETFTVIIQVQPIANITCATAVNITEGENVSCICSGVGGNPPATAYWLKDNSIPITKGYLSSLLDIRNVSKNDAGTYICRVQSGTLIDEQRVDIVFVPPVAKITCATPVNLTEGENFSCICSGVSGHPPPTAYWLKDNNPTSITKGYLSAPLDIKNISKNDAGTYICRVQSGTLTDEQRIDVTVFDKLVVNVTCNTSVSIEEGKTFSCKCSGNDGSPPPSIMWLKDDDKLTTVDNILTLRNISKNGTYVCRVQSGNLKKEKRVHVTVLYEPRNISFSSNEPNNTVTSGNTVQITCKADAFPEASYSISFNGSQPLTDAVDGSYTISSVNDNHAGNYICVAKNSLGNVSAQFVLTVKDVDECLRASICPTGSFCVNTVGSYKCNCNEGLYKDKTGQCVKGVSYRATFKLNIAFTADLENSSSPAYITLESNLISAISSAYQSNSFFFAVLVNGFSEGSVVADVTIIFNTSRSSPLAELKKVKNGKLGNYTVDLSSIKLIEGAPTSKKDNIAAIVGGAIGGVVFLIILILLIWYCKRSAGGSRKRDMIGREDDIVGNSLNPSYVAALGDSMDGGNPYESVDQAKIDQARRADEAGPSNESPADAGKKSPPDAANSLPPVYAVVDKSKITPKPPPEKKPDALTYASLDPVLLQPDSSKMRDRTREETNYASIDLDKLTEHQV